MKKGFMERLAEVPALGDRGYAGELEQCADVIGFERPQVGGATCQP